MLWAWLAASQAFRFAGRRFFVRREQVKTAGGEGEKTPGRLRKALFRGGIICVARPACGLHRRRRPQAGRATQMIPPRNSAFRKRPGVFSLPSPPAVFFTCSRRTKNRIPAPFGPAVGSSQHGPSFAGRAIFVRRDGPKRLGTAGGEGGENPGRLRSTIPRRDHLCCASRLRSSS